MLPFARKQIADWYCIIVVHNLVRLDRKNTIFPMKKVLPVTNHGVRGSFVAVTARLLFATSAEKQKKDQDFENWLALFPSQF